MQAISGFCICHFGGWFLQGGWLRDALFIRSIANELHAHTHNNETKWALINLQLEHCLSINRLSLVLNCNADSITCYITRLACIFRGDAIVFVNSQWEPRFSFYLLANSESMWLSFGFLSSFQHHFISSEVHEQRVDAAHYFYAETLLYIYFGLLDIECNL